MKKLKLILRAVALALGIAVVVTSILDGIDTKSALILLGIGLTCSAFDKFITDKTP